MALLIKELAEKREPDSQEQIILALEKEIEEMKAKPESMARVFDVKARQLRSLCDEAEQS